MTMADFFSSDPWGERQAEYGLVSVPVSQALERELESGPPTPQVSDWSKRHEQNFTLLADAESTNDLGRYLSVLASERQIYSEMQAAGLIRSTREYRPGEPLEIKGERASDASSSYPAWVAIGAIVLVVALYGRK